MSANVNPVNPKVSAAALASAVAGAAVWALGAFVFKGEVPEPVAILVVSAVTFAAGYLKTDATS